MDPLRHPSPSGYKWSIQPGRRDTVRRQPAAHLFTHGFTPFRGGRRLAGNVHKGVEPAEPAVLDAAGLAAEAPPGVVPAVVASPVHHRPAGVAVAPGDGALGWWGWWGWWFHLGGGGLWWCGVVGGPGGGGGAVRAVLGARSGGHRIGA